MNTVYKYPLELAELQSIKLPYRAEVLKVAHDAGGQLCIWAQVDTTLPTVSTLITISGTGSPVPAKHEFLDTVFDGQFVWHVWMEERKETIE
jgi:hypothetical protein